MTCRQTLMTSLSEMILKRLIITLTSIRMSPRRLLEWRNASIWSNSLPNPRKQGSFRLWKSESWSSGYIWRSKHKDKAPWSQLNPKSTSFLSSLGITSTISIPSNRRREPYPRSSSASARTERRTQLEHKKGSRWANLITLRRLSSQIPTLWCSSPSTRSQRWSATSRLTIQRSGMRSREPGSWIRFEAESTKVATSPSPTNYLKFHFFYPKVMKS